jgi:ABC-type bacteriocin/lantibiotic exporter with double-glycine peptidase domain
MNFSRAHVYSHESCDCGAAVLCTVLLHYGKRIPVARIAAHLGIDHQGLSLDRLLTSARQLGFTAAAGRVRRDNLSKLTFPIIAHYEDKTIGHYVVVHKATDRMVVVSDPSVGLRTIDRSSFDKKWSGFVLLLTPFAIDQQTEEHWISSYKSLIFTCSEHAQLFLLAFMFAVGSATCGIAVPYAMRSLFDKTIPSHEPGGIWSIQVLFVLLILGKICFSFLRNFILSVYSARVDTGVASRYLASLLRLPLFYVERRSLSDFLTRLNDITHVRNLVGGSLLALVLDSGLALGALLIVMRINVAFALVLLSLSIPIVVIAYHSSNSLIALHLEVRSALREFTSDFVESIYNYRLFKSLRLEDKANSSLLSKYYGIQDALLKRDHLNNSVTAKLSLSSSCIVIYILVYGSSLATSHHLSGGGLIMLYSAAAILCGAIDNSASTIASLKQAIASLEAIDGITANPLLEPSPELSPAPAAGSLPKEQSEVMLSCSGLSFSYSNRADVLRNITFEIRPGELIAIIGETGCGKSTLATVLSGLSESYQGTIKFGGTTVTQTSQRLRELVHVVPQENNLISGSIRDNIRLGNGSALDSEIYNAAELACAISFISTLPRSFDHYVVAGAHGLSTGQRQRIALARSILVNPYVLILDEGTSGLDAITEKRVLSNLVKSRADRITILITHRIDRAGHADRCFVMKQGEIVEQGRPQDLMTGGGYYYELWSAYHVS